MRRSVLVALVCVVPSALSAQLGELQVGALASYGVSDPYGAGAGLVLGIAPGRLVYVGLHWIYYAGSTYQVDVTNRAQVFATDLGVQIPLRGGSVMELRPGIALGVVRFAQHGSDTTGTFSDYSAEFFAAPGIALQLSSARIAIIPQVAYYFTGHTEMTWPVQNKGVAFSLRFVYLSEIGRIRR